MNREEIKVSRKLLSEWVSKTGMALKSLYDEMLKEVLGSKNILIDETPIKKISTGKCKQAYMWVVIQILGSIRINIMFSKVGRAKGDHLVSLLESYKTKFF